jgi:hypothetical protein
MDRRHDLIILTHSMAATPPGQLASDAKKPSGWSRS